MMCHDVVIECHEAVTPKLRAEALGNYAKSRLAPQVSHAEGVPHASGMWRSVRST